MSFIEKLKLFMEDKTEAKLLDIDKLNKNPESKQTPEVSLKIPEDTKTLQQFITLVNPLRGEVKRCALFRYIKEFRQRGKDVLILKGKSTDKVLPFYSVDRGQLTAFIASIMDDEEAMKTFTSQIQTIYSQEETELQPQDYIDFLIKGKISIMTNPAEESFGVEEVSENIPTNMTPKNQEDLEVQPQKTEDSGGIDKSQKEKEKK